MTSYRTDAMVMHFVQTVIPRQLSGRPGRCESSDRDGGYSIGHRRGDRAKESAATSPSFEDDSNQTALSDLQSVKHNVQSTSTDVGRIIDIKSLN
jgi:hypothetical protein